MCLARITNHLNFRYFVEKLDKITDYKKNCEYVAETEKFIQVQYMVRNLSSKIIL